MTNYTTTITDAPFNAVGDGLTDCTLAINQAIAATVQGGIVYVPAGSYRVTGLINLTRGVSLVGLSLGSEEVKGCYANLIADAAVSIVVAIDGGADSHSSSVKSLGITRNTMSPPSGSIGLQIGGSNLVLIEDCTINNHDRGIFLSNAVSPRLVRVNTWACQSQHVLIEKSVEVEFDTCRFGRNGTHDTNTGTLIFLTGTQWDTIRLLNCQGNLGNGLNAAQVIAIDGYNNPNGIIEINGGHYEGFNGAMITLTSSTILLRRLMLTGVSISSASSGIPLISSQPAKITDLVISACTIDCKITFDNIAYVNMTGTVLNSSSDFIVSACSGAITGNSFKCGVKLQGAMTGLTYVGNRQPTLSDNSTGSRVVASNITA